MNRCRLLNAEFDAVTLPQAVDWARDLMVTGRRAYICTVNVAILMMMRDNAGLQRFADQAGLTIADGQPLIWYSRLRRSRLPERVAGVDLADSLCQLAAREGFGVYLLGAQSNVVQEVARQLQRRHKGLRIAGAADGFFEPSEAAARADAVRNSGASILIVAMGVPRQEDFLQEQWDRLGVSLAIPVGGSFDVIAGKRKRAPALLQRFGFEWLFRLLQEPRRLFKRYLLTNTRFLLLVVRDSIVRDARMTQFPETQRVGQSVVPPPHNARNHSTRPKRPMYP